jgi:hypothetical protein
MAGYAAPYAGSDELPTVTLPPPAKKKRRFGGMSWIFIGLLVFFVAAAAFTAIVAPKRNSPVLVSGRQWLSRTSVLMNSIIPMMA